MSEMDLGAFAGQFFQNQLMLRNPMNAIVSRSMEVSAATDVQAVSDNVTTRLISRAEQVNEENKKQWLPEGGVKADTTVPDSGFRNAKLIQQLEELNELDMQRVRSLSK